MKQLFLALLTFSVVAFAPISNHQCQQMREEFIKPGRNVLAFLKTDPDLETLSGPGCLYILQQLKTFPLGAELTRRLAAQKAENATSRCLYRVSSIQYPCTEPKLGEARCLPQSYRFCAQWEYSLTNDSRFESAMELSFKLDSAYEKGQRLCGAAMARDDKATLDASRDLERYLEAEVTPRAAKAYAQNCAR